MLNTLLNKTHQILARSRKITLICLKIRNQMNCVINYHIGGIEGAYINSNGESELIKLIAPNCKKFVDVGANNGEWSNLFLKYSNGSGILFEPGKKCYDILIQKMDNTRVSICPQAVGDIIGEIDFVEDIDSDQLSSVATTFTGGNNQSKYTIPLTTLDSEFLATGETIDYLKIDTEGYDLNVIKGSEELIKKGNIRFIQFEYNTGWVLAGSTIHYCINLLQSYGYSVYIIHKNGLYSINLNTWGEYYAFSNYIAVNNKDKDIVNNIYRGAM